MSNTCCTPFHTGNPPRLLILRCQGLIGVLAARGPVYLILTQSNRIFVRISWPMCDNLAVCLSARRSHRTGPHSRKVQANLPCWRPCRYHICAGKEAHRRHFLVVKTVEKEYFWCVLAVCQGTAQFQLVDTVRLHVRTAPFSGCTGTIVKVHRLSECNSNSRRRIAIITHLNWIQPVILPVKVF